MTWVLVSALFVFLVLAFIFVAFNYGSPRGLGRHRIAPESGVDEPGFERTVSQLLGAPTVGGNRVEALQNGDRIFAAMLAAIRAAERSITFETFIYWSGKIGVEFCDALVDRARAGVRVHVLLDWLGSRKFDQKDLRRLRAGGVEVRYYRPLGVYHLFRINLRTHRKLLVIDGKVGFTGGVGIADAWRGDARGPREWRESHFRVEGPVVAQLQSAFMDNWLNTSETVPIGDRYFPELPDVGDQRAQALRSGPRIGASRVRLMYLLAITHARKRIRLGMAYFVPDSWLARALVAAARRGVQVQVIVPGRHADAKITRFASRARWGRLLAGGVEIHEYEPTMYHCKFMVVDGSWVSVGSTNFDQRSFRLNSECNLNVLDAGLGAELEAVFENDLRHCRRVKLAKWRTRPLVAKTLDRLSALLESQV